MPELRKLNDFATLKGQAIVLRQKTSQTLTKTHVFKGAIETITALNSDGAAIYVATEATENAASDAICWLGLDGVIGAAYAWPFKKPYIRAKKTRIWPFPTDPQQPDQFLQKPHPLILGAIVLDEAKRRGLIPLHTTPQEVFEFVIDESLDIGPLKRKAEEAISNNLQKAQATEAVRAIRTRLIVKSGPHKDALEKIRQHCFYLGDSLFRDGFLARNANIPFIHAQYGKTVADEDRDTHNRAKRLLFRVTGWNRTLMGLTQEAGQLSELTDLIEPHLVCRDSLQDLQVFLGRAHTM